MEFKILVKICLANCRHTDSASGMANGVLERAEEAWGTTAPFQKGKKIYPGNAKFWAENCFTFWGI